MDLAKSERRKRERGFDFSYAISVFKYPVLLKSLRTEGRTFGS